MNDLINKHAMDTCHLLAQYVEQYVDNLKNISDSDETILKIVQAMDDFDPYRVAQIIRNGMHHATESLQREMAELKADNIRLTLLLNELEMGCDFDEEIF